MNSIGLDVSKSTIAVHIPKGNLDLEIENTLPALKSLYAKLKKLYKKEFKALVWVFESTGSYSSLLYRFCAQRGIRVFLPNPKQARGFAKAIAQRNKSDRIDARVLAASVVIAKAREIKVPTLDPLVESFKELLGYYRLLIKQKSQWKNHQEALRAKGTNVQLLRRIERQIQGIEKEQQTLLASLVDTIRQDEELSRKFEALLSIPGVGELTAIVLLHLFLRYPDANQRQIVSLAGLDPLIRESGSSLKSKARISKAGDRLYRAVLFMPAMVAIRHNAKLQAFYERLKANGKHTTVAQVAVMRKLLIIAHSLYKSGQNYKEG